MASLLKSVGNREMYEFCKTGYFAIYKYSVGYILYTMPIYNFYKAQ